MGQQACKSNRAVVLKETINRASLLDTHAAIVKIEAILAADTLCVIGATYYDKIGIELVTTMKVSETEVLISTNPTKGPIGSGLAIRVDRVFIVLLIMLMI